MVGRTDEGAADPAVGRAGSGVLAGAVVCRDSTIGACEIGGSIGLVILVGVEIGATELCVLAFGATVGADRKALGVGIGLGGETVATGASVVAGTIAGAFEC